MDALIYTVADAKLFRLLMNRARLDDGSASKYSGRYVDIYQLILPVPSLGSVFRTKNFYFDSETGLLDRVTYRGGTGGAVRTLGLPRGTPC